MEEKILHREWVKNVAIVFLAVLLVLTFFSNTIMNRTLPEVAAKQVVSGSITALVRTSGKVEADGSYEVKAEQSRTIRSVMVKAGDEVSTGDVLFVLGEGDSEELEAAQDTLRSLQTSYQRAAVGVGVHDYHAEEIALKNAETKYKDALAQEKTAKEKMDEETEEGVHAERIGKLKEEIKKLEIELEAETDKWDAKKTSANADIDLALQNYNAALEDYNQYLEKYNETIDDSEHYNIRLKEKEDIKDSTYAAYENAKTIYNDLLNNEPEVIKQLNNQISEHRKEIDALLAMGGTSTAEYNAARDARIAAENSLAEIRSSLESQKRRDEQSDTLSYIELSDIGAQIERQKKKVSELSGGVENEITAQVSGIVQSVNITAGNQALKGDVICVLEVPDLGYSLTSTVSSEQARRLRIGDTATVSNYYWGQEVIATLKSIQNDPKNPQQSKLLTFSLEGDVSAGSELKLSVGSKSASYDTILPNSAIRSDSNGSFVLVIQEKSSPLGNRYIAVRQPVDILASDDENSAVYGGVEAGDFVITTSSRPINAGDQVRMAD